MNKHLVLHLLLATALIVVICSRPATSADDATSEDKVTSAEDAIANLQTELKTLRTERRDTLRMVVEVVDTYYKSGQATLGTLIDARNDLLDAELELIARTDAESRKKLHQRRIENLKKLELASEEQYKLGSGSAENRFKAKVARLQAEIEFLEERIPQTER